MCRPTSLAHVSYPPPGAWLTMSVTVLPAQLDARDGSAVGTGAAFLYSLVGTLTPGLFPPQLRGHQGEVGVYYEIHGARDTVTIFTEEL